MGPPSSDLAYCCFTPDPGADPIGSAPIRNCRRIIFLALLGLIFWLGTPFLQMLATDIAAREHGSSVSGTDAVAQTNTAAQSGSPPTTGAPDCPSSETASASSVQPADIPGQWIDAATGATIVISKVADPARYHLQGNHDWEGSLDGGKLTFRRKPEPAEMGEAAPDWARKLVAGKLEWSMELTPKLACGDLILEGQWFPGEIKFHQETDPKGNVVALSALLGGRGSPIAIRLTKQIPAIAGVIVMTDQTEFVTRDQPKWPYPFAANGGSMGPPADQSRTLFVFGRGLPRRWSETKAFESGDSAVEYLVTALDGDPKASPIEVDQFKTGWKQALRNLDEPTRKLAQSLNAILVHAKLKTGVLPGVKQFKLNGLDAAWRLRFGDDRASMSFVREIPGGVWDPTEYLLVPEQVALEIRLEANLPLSSIALKVSINGRAVSWNGAPTLSATRTGPNTYVTSPIEFYDTRFPVPPPKPGVFQLPASPGQTVLVKPEDPFLLGMTPPVLKVPILRTPAELGMTWKEALTRAANAYRRGDSVASNATAMMRTIPRGNLTEIYDWDQLSAAKSTEISNVIITSLLLKGVMNGTPLGFLRGVPVIYQFIKPIERGKVIESTPITIGEHAALLLFRNEFVRAMTEAVKNLDAIQGDVALRGFRQALKISAWDESSPWRYIRIKCPHGGDCPFPYAVDDDYLERQFPGDREAADKWSLQATAEGLAYYKQAAHNAIAGASAITDGDIAGLIKIVGYSYQPMLPAAQARMMRLVDIGTPPRQFWIPDLNARYQLRNLHTVVDAILAQQDFSQLDTQMAMLAASAASAPFMLGEGAVAVAVAWGTDTTFLGVSLATEVPEFFQQRDEIRFALGASLVLGTQHLQEAELRKTEWFQLLASVGPAALGTVVSTVRAVGIVRTSLVLHAVETGGLNALSALSEADKNAFWRFATESKLLAEAGETKAITSLHRRALDAVDNVLGELHINPVKGQPEAEAIAAVASPAKAETLQLPQPQVTAVDETVELKQVAEADATQAGNDAKNPNGALNGPRGPPEGQAAEPLGANSQSLSAGDTSVAQFRGIQADPRVLRPPVENGIFYAVYDGKVYPLRLERFLGEGVDAKVFLFADNRIPGCANGCALKIYDADSRAFFFGGGRDQVRAIQAGGDLLTAKDIKQLKNLRCFPDAPQPYIIQDSLGQDPDHWFYFDKQKWPTMDLIEAEFQRRPELGKATLELFAEMRNKGLAWEDAHLRNIYFERQNGTWVAGILDQDRIIEWGDRRPLGKMGAWFGFSESILMPNELNSMRAFESETPFSFHLDHGADEGFKAEAYYLKNPGPYLPDLDLYWEKTLERKGWLKFENGTYQRGFLTPAEVENVFPRLRDPERLGPFNPTIPAWQTRSSSWLEPVILVPRRVVAMGAPPANDAEFRLAA